MEVELHDSRRYFAPTAFAVSSCDTSPKLSFLPSRWLQSDHRVPSCWQQVLPVLFDDASHPAWHADLSEGFPCPLHHPPLIDGVIEKHSCETTSHEALSLQTTISTTWFAFTRSCTNEVKLLCGIIDAIIKQRCYMVRSMLNVRKGKSDGYEKESEQKENGFLCTKRFSVVHVHHYRRFYEMWLVCPFVLFPGWFENCQSE